VDKNPTEKVIVRPIRPGDAEELGDLFQALAADSASASFHPHPMTRAEAARLAGGFESRKDIYFAAFAEERLVGYGMLRGWDDGYATPSFGVAVGPTYRGGGIGRSLLRYAIACARERGASTMMLKVHLDNPSARHLYESEGFVFQAISDDSAQIKGLLAL
jgi:ribosomal-protein-alanine N-acetyltransferase